MAKRVSKYSIPNEAGIEDAVSEGFSVLEELGAECREIVDNASDGLPPVFRRLTKPRVFLRA